MSVFYFLKCPIRKVLQKKEMKSRLHLKELVNWNFIELTGDDFVEYSADGFGNDGLKNFYKLVRIFVYKCINSFTYNCIAIEEPERKQILNKNNTQVPRKLPPK